MSTFISDDQRHLLAVRLRLYIANLLRNIWVGIKASLLLKIRYEQLTSSWSQLVGFLILCVLMPLAVQRYQIGAKGEFTASGLTGAWFLLPIAVMTSVLAAKLARLEERTLALIITLLSCGLFIELSAVFTPFLLRTILLTNLIDRYGRYADTIQNYWLITATAFALTRLLYLSRKQRLAAYAVIGLCMYLPLNYAWVDDTLWSEPYDTASKEKLENYRAAVREDMLYLQPKLLDQQLNEIQPGKSGTSTLYFIGMAGDSEQDVFMREINSVDKLFQDRFAVATHDIKLINNRSTLQTTPLATTTALKLAIQRIGSVMDKDNDVLFLYLTSHGSKQHEFYIEFPPLELNNLNPSVFRQMLDEAGIKWRVIVIAACYSGGFIAPLKGDNTLVITAAAADRTSFGCGNENDYTYFGRAYFVDGLKATNSFIKAFSVAKDVVTRRERKDGFEPSNPQIAIGKNIEAQLEQLPIQHQAAL